jgi:predicted TPR repeat methyltransferase
MEKHQGFSQENIGAHYDDLATNYEQIYLTVGWPDPKKAASLLEELVSAGPDAGQRRTEVEVLDMGCGTGLVGQYLSEYGFTKIDGLDAS